MMGAILALVVVMAIFIIIILVAALLTNAGARNVRMLQEDLRNAERIDATVVSIDKRGTTSRFILNVLAGLSGSWASLPEYSYYLMVEWTNPETQGRVTSETKKMNGPCPYKVGDTVSILIHPDKLEVWLDEQPAT